MPRGDNAILEPDPAPIQDQVQQENALHYSFGGQDYTIVLV